MTHESFPNDAHNSRTVTLAEHEQIATPFGLSGLLNYNSVAPVFADATGLHVKLRVGVKASIRGTRFNCTSETLIAIGPNTSGKPRVDLVVLRLRRQETSLGAGDHYTVAPYVIQGTPEDTPVKPAPVRDDTPGTGFWDVPLAAVTVPHNAVTIGATQTVSQAYYIAGSGYTGRDDWAKPPVEPGVLFQANDTGITYIGNVAGSWYVLYDDSGELAFTPEGGATQWSYGVNSVRRTGGIVTGSISTRRLGKAIPVGSPHVIIARLPAGCFPVKSIEVAAYVAGSGATYCAINPNGTLTVRPLVAVNTNNYVIMSAAWRAQ